MSIFEDELIGETHEKDPKSKSSPAYQMAAKLAKIIRSYRKVSKAPNLNTWAKSFKDLLNDETEEEVNAVLDWYAKNKECQKILSAGGFCVFFSSLREKMENDPKEVEISSFLVPTIERLKSELSWPSGSDRLVDLVCQRSFENYMAFRRILTRIRFGTDKESFEWKLIEHLIPYMGLPISFVENWMTEVNEVVVNWDGWSGDLIKYIFDYKHPIFNNMMYNWTWEYCHSSSAWGKVIKLVEKEVLSS